MIAGHCGKGTGNKGLGRSGITPAGAAPSGARSHSELKTKVKWYIVPKVYAIPRSQSASITPRAHALRIQVTWDHVVLTKKAKEQGRVFTVIMGSNAILSLVPSSHPKFKTKIKWR